MPRLPLLSALIFSLVSTGSLAWSPSGLPPLPAEGPALCPGPFLKPAEGQSTLDQARAAFPDPASWQAYAKIIREHVQQAAGLAPLPRRTPLNVILGDVRWREGYSVQNVAFESVPGYFVCANLYRPSSGAGPFPVVLSTHGHARPVEKPADYEQQARFTPWMQTRCANLARLGAMALSIEMVGYGESIDQVGQAAHKNPFAMTLQVWNAMRALDYLLAQPGADPERVAVSGESGGGTQTFLLTALDPRVKLSAPVVMVSSYFFGGCSCESGRPIHRGPNYFANNVMIAALAAPRPLLLVSDGRDWTEATPRSEFPFLQHLYGYYGVRENVENVHLAAEGHDYGPSKRAALYAFLIKRFGLNQGRAYTETPAEIETPDALRIFTPQRPRPATACADMAEVEKVLRQLQASRS